MRAAGMLQKLQMGPLPSGKCSLMVAKLSHPIFRMSDGTHTGVRNTHHMLVDAGIISLAQHCMEVVVQS
jgi:hypothetical protein